MKLQRFPLNGRVRPRCSPSRDGEAAVPDFSERPRADIDPQQLSARKRPFIPMTSRALQDRQTDAHDNAATEIFQQRLAASAEEANRGIAGATSYSFVPSLPYYSVQSLIQLCFVSPACLVRYLALGHSFYE